MYARHSYHHKNVLFLIHVMIDPRTEKNRFVYSLFKTWRRKAIPRVKKSNVKWKCGKKNSSEREPRKNVLKINFLLFRVIFPSFFIDLFHFRVIFSQVTECSAHNFQNDVLTFRTEPEKRDTEAVVYRCFSK